MGSNPTLSANPRYQVFEFIKHPNFELPRSQLQSQIRLKVEQLGRHPPIPASADSRHCFGSGGQNFCGHRVGHGFWVTAGVQTSQGRLANF